MKQNSSCNKETETYSYPKVEWAELFPVEFKRRQRECPIVYLPYGLCEPHGQISAFGLDSIKAEWLCVEAARQIGGIVAPSMGYHIHETGYHARWLQDTVGQENPHMTGMPPDVVLRFFLYQLRTFVNAGFRGIVVLSGHSGGNQYDFRLVAKHFTEKIGIPIFVASDPELVEGKYRGDHAGKYEISQLMYLRPELVNASLNELAEQPGSGGRLALGEDYDEASYEHGRTIMSDLLCALSEKVSKLKSDMNPRYELKQVISFQEVEEIWSDVMRVSSHWRTVSPWKGQEPVADTSQWKSCEYYKPER
jgi:creatinine amidohydrolase